MLPPYLGLKYLFESSLRIKKFLEEEKTMGEKESVLLSAEEERIGGAQTFEKKWRSFSAKPLRRGEENRERKWRV